MDAETVSAVLTAIGLLQTLLKQDGSVIPRMLGTKKSPKFPYGFIILINGGTGVGKTTLAWELAKRLGGASVIGSDLVRAVARHYEGRLGTPSDHPIHRSSYRPGAVMRPAKDDFLEQSNIMLDPLLTMIGRIREKRHVAIIEGVNIVASSLFEARPVLIDPHTPLLFINLNIDSEAMHKARIRQRSGLGQSTEEVDSYIENMQRIREISTFLTQDTAQYSSKLPNVFSVENSGSLADALKKISNKLETVVKAGNKER